MIELGLQRISRLLAQTPLPWQAIHVAGTNGKGSICAYISSMLETYNSSTCRRSTGFAALKHGRFTSPHLVDRWDCISLNNHVVPYETFNHVERLVLQRDQQENIGASEFELLTATSFELFTRAQVDVAVVEIGLDHQAFLGDTLTAIAWQKAGIIKPGVPVVFDASNSAEVQSVIRSRAADYGSDVVEATDCEIPGSLLRSAVCQVLSGDEPGDEPGDAALTTTNYPGRLQNLSIEPLTGREHPILLDGAHNAQSAQVLAAEVSRQRREAKERVNTSAVTWVMAFSSTKDVSEILRPLLKAGDSVFVVEFGPVDGMPWVEPMACGKVAEAVQKAFAQTVDVRLYGRDVSAALQAASSLAGEGPLVIAGSLYLVGDVLRLLRNTPVGVS
ncbi:hypothetical protein BAUCODRAFT_68829 [Baudoinia panamericana UAMH 10762]|uniref:Mur ligase central domain-containing protein n=1 Tax=Baudoinia panamericana (strain UAMH 10762) TaxID=717646 RepID=M2N0Z9_BAUPA|nr:uncharacterized protein BAUCODRAFT_68829 [Baudoinia panamericana UAMH 10762]EMC97603.1 hypothetical protein BAUCODRAFT_68829 [Baudoinia panamericana UAMH 10762]